MLFLQTGCLKKKKVDPWHEGELVTWRFNDNFVVKMKLGQRRIHIPTSSLFYDPAKEAYLGQFPIDYQPQRYPLLTENEAKQVPFKRFDSFDGIEFSLILNGSTVQSTDKSASTMLDDALDHRDQVKVSISHIDRSFSFLTTKQQYLDALPSEDSKYDKSMSDKYDMTCHRDESGYDCFAESSNPDISGLRVRMYDSQSKVRVSYSELVYDGINLSWYVHKDNLNQWRKIDANIWRLLETWNVSPITEIQELINNPREDLSKTDTPKANTGKVLAFKITPKMILSAYQDETNPYNRKMPERHLGQFPIDFVPTTPVRKDIKDISSVASNEVVTFTLFQNGLKDHYILSRPSLNRIFVWVNGNENVTSEKARIRINHLLEHSTDIKPDDKFIQHNMLCYPMEYDDLSCIGQPKDTSLSEVYLSISPISNGKLLKIDSISSSTKYPNISLKWSAITKSFEDWEEIEGAVWRSIDAMAVTPLENDVGQ